jgi:hypothetical protein
MSGRITPANPILNNQGFTGRGARSDKRAIIPPNYRDTTNTSGPRRTHLRARRSPVVVRAARDFTCRALRIAVLRENILPLAFAFVKYMCAAEK